MQHNKLTNQYILTWTGSMLNISPVSSLIFKVWRDSSASSTRNKSYKQNRNRIPAISINIHDSTV